jgi:hypothetical protein
VRKVEECPDYGTLGDLRGAVVCNNGQCGVGKTYRFHQWLEQQDTRGGPRLRVLSFSARRVQAQGLAADSSDLGFRCYLGSSTRELQKYDRVITSMESLLILSRDPPAVGGAELEPEPAPTYDVVVVVLDEVVSLAAAFGGVTMHSKTNTTVELLQRICMNASYIFASDADWDERAELLVCNLKGTQLLPAVLFDVAKAPMQRQMQLYFAGSGNATWEADWRQEPEADPGRGQGAGATRVQAQQGESRQELPHRRCVRQPLEAGALGAGPRHR